MANEGQPFLVQAVYPFRGGNNDELCFKKGDIIIVTQTEEGGWWEGTFEDKTGWFPTNYVKEYKVQADSLSPTKTSSDIIVNQQRAYRSEVLKGLIESERAHVGELENLVSTFIQPLEKADILTKEEFHQLTGNLKEVISVHESLLSSLEAEIQRNPNEQRVGKLFLTLAPRLKQVHHTYCAGHPKGAALLNKPKQKLTDFYKDMRGNLISLTAGLSKPFRRLDKYSCHLQELERHLEETHPDRGDTQRAISVYKDISGSCSAVRRQKELELEVVNGGVRGWEGQELSTLGDIIHMGSVAVGPEHKDRYLVLFPTTLLILSVSHRMSAFIYEGKLPLTGIKVTKLEDSDTYKNAFEVMGTLIDPIIAVCQTKEDQQKWVSVITEQCNVIGAKASPLNQAHRKSRSITDDIPTDAAWSIFCLRPSPPAKSCLIKTEKPQKNAEKNFEEDAQILRVIEAYCSSSNSRYTMGSELERGLQILLEEKDKLLGKGGFTLNNNNNNNNNNNGGEQKKIIDTVFGLQEKVSGLQEKIDSLTQNVLEERKAREHLQNLIQSYMNKCGIKDILISSD